MNLNSIFKKPVNRPIEGVIKADDDTGLRLEIDEYVITDEIEKRLESFLEAYNHYANANGVWISGFFGSGKSHLLKMLALVLENREIDGARAADAFIAKCSHNEFLRAELKRAASIPSQSILFNIDQKADVISKTQIDALLAVFVKVFDETCGYYGKQPHIAQFERDLDSRGHYGDFKAAYEAIAGKPWSKGREQALLEGRSIAKAYAQVSGDDAAAAEGILDKYRSQYRLSIDDFAEQVKAYVEKRGGDFRLNFFVDEVGQYIADNIKLMTNLQTVAESLATKCRGRAWVIVTAQEDMNTVVGEMGKNQANDFTKIQARFKNRMKLTSADVAEVIQKRLLTKTEPAAASLGTLYHAQANNFKTLFDFADGAQTYRNFQDIEHFVRSYPFVPYQFPLFQAAIQSLSQHNAFEGKHSSVGERSMLGVFQQVAIHLGGKEVGQLATFDLMFEGIRTALKSGIQRAVLNAEQHLGDPYAVRVLKALFLVKYVKEFKPTLRNLCVLMLDSFTEDLPTLRKRLEAALNLLELQTYIQRNGDLYEFLTDEEKDVEQEIKNTDIDPADVLDELDALVFDHILKTRKIRYEANGQDYPFTRRIDDRFKGRENELSINVVSPFNPLVDQEEKLKLQSMGRDELLLILPADDRLVSDLMMYKRTQKYVSQNVTTAQQEGIKRILADKTTQNHERHSDLLRRLKELMGRARLVAQGVEIDVGGEDPVARISRGFQDLIARIYPNLKMLPGATYSENDLSKYLRAAQDSLYGQDVAILPESEQEMLAFIQGNKNRGVRTTVKGVIERFERKPYGWYYAAILCTLAKLFARGKVEARADGNLLDETQLEKQLRSSAAHGNLVIEPQEIFTTQQVRALKDLYQSLFDAPARASEIKALATETASAMEALERKLDGYLKQDSLYPFVEALRPVIGRLQEHKGKPYGWFATEWPRQADAWLEDKERVIDPLATFMEGPKRAIYDEARDLFREQKANFDYVEGEEPTTIQRALEDLEAFRGNRMQQLKGALDRLREALDARFQAERDAADEALAKLRRTLEAAPEFAALAEARQAELLRPFDALRAEIARESVIAVIRDKVRAFRESRFPSLLSQMTAWNEPVNPATPEEPDTGTTRPAPKEVYVHRSKVQVNFDKPWLTDQDDVDRFVAKYREALLTEVRSGKRVQV